MSLAKEKIETLTESSPSYLKSLLIPLELAGDLAEGVKCYLRDCRQTIYDKMDEKVPASRLVRLQSLMMDQLITSLYRRGFEESQVQGGPPVPIALFAQGGYGRAELNLFSDIDLLFVYEGKSKKSLETVVNRMLYPLWDAKEEVGYATRTLDDCSRAMQDDVKVMSSIMDARFLAGDQEIARKFFRFLESKTSSARTLKRFMKGKLHETEERLQKFGGSVYVVEPNLKESEGGLRDWHTLRYFAWLATKSSKMEDWIRAGLINNEEAEQLRRALEFIWEVRNHLHRKTRKEQDQLDFEFQKPLAIELGFETGGGKLEAEKFMQTYYSHAANLLRLREEISRRIQTPPQSTWSRLKNHFRPSLSDFFINVNKEVLPKSFRRVESHPIEIVRAFSLAQKKKLVLDEGFKSWISRHLHLVDDAYRNNSEVGRIMQEMFEDVSGIGKTLWEMHDCRFLGVLIPEFGEILHQTQHDVYHVYTVDTHSIKAVQELSKLKNGEYDKEFPVFKLAMGEVKSPSALVLGTLFHDIGKGKGGRHSEVGAKLAQTIMTRLGYSDQKRAQVEFLVLSHLIMPHLSQRRDLEDMNLIHQFARTMENFERLNLLFILTWADIRAVGPEVWTPWKGSLLRELYEKTRSVMEKGEFPADRAIAVMEGVKAKVLETAPKRINKEKVQVYMDSMPPRYFLAASVEEILEHFEWLENAEDKNFVLRQTPNIRGKFNELFIYTYNSPHLFEQVTGVMAANQVNILGFEQFYNNEGEALLLLRVTDHRGGLLEEERRFKNLERDLKSIVRGKVSLEDYSKSRSRPTYFGKKASGKPPRVEVDQDVSPYYTVIDIYADDRIGLLYNLARMMRKLHLFVEVSKIATKVDQVSDAFYVKDIFGHKINDRDKVKTIKNTLSEVLKQPEEV